MQESISRTVLRAQAGDSKAFESLVRQFQDLVVGYAITVLGDLHLAEDAAQEAFLAAYLDLSALREPAAFPGWLKRITLKQCDRITRRKRFNIVPLAETDAVAANNLDPEQRLIRQEVHSRIRMEIGNLPVQEREVITLFYISEIPQKSIASFLDIPLSSVKNRLHVGRKRLKQRMIRMVKESLHERRPSRDEAFADRVMDIISAADKGDVGKVTSLLARDPSLATAEGPVPEWYHEDFQALHVACGKGHVEVVKKLVESGADVNVKGSAGLTPLSLAIIAGNSELIDYLIEKGAEIDICAAAQMGDFDRVKAFLDADPNAVNTKGPEGARPLHYAKTTEIAKLLIERGADVNARDEFHKRTPLFWKAGDRAMVDLLLGNGAVVDDIFTATLIGDLQAVKLFIKSDPSLIQARPHDKDMYAGGTPLHIATVNGHDEIVKFLVECDADLTLKDGSHDSTPKGWALYFGQKETAKLLEELAVNS